MGVRVDAAPGGTFYVWGCLADLPAPPHDATEFFTRALEFRVITVPGHLFDVNPGGRRRSLDYRQWARFSFGPSYDTTAEGLGRLASMIEKSR